MSTCSSTHYIMFKFSERHNILVLAGAVATSTRCPRTPRIHPDTIDCWAVPSINNYFSSSIISIVYNCSSTILYVKNINYLSFIKYVCTYINAVVSRWIRHSTPCVCWYFILIRLISLIISSNHIDVIIQFISYCTEPNKNKCTEIIGKVFIEIRMENCWVEVFLFKPWYYIYFIYINNWFDF